jgi:hypothetical protein
VLSTTANIHTIRIARYESKVITFINDIQIATLAFRRGVGLFRVYSESTSASINFTTKFRNFNVRPVLVIGENIAV